MTTELTIEELLAMRADYQDAASRDAGWPCMWSATRVVNFLDVLIASMQREERLREVLTHERRVTAELRNRLDKYEPPTAYTRDNPIVREMREATINQDHLYEYP